MAPGKKKTKNRRRRSRAPPFIKRKLSGEAIRLTKKAERESKIDCNKNERVDQDSGKEDGTNANITAKKNPRTVTSEIKREHSKTKTSREKERNARRDFKRGEKATHNLSEGVGGLGLSRRAKAFRGGGRKTVA